MDALGARSAQVLHRGCSPQQPAASVVASMPSDAAVLQSNETHRVVEALSAAWDHRPKSKSPPAQRKRLAPRGANGRLEFHTARIREDAQRSGVAEKNRREASTRNAQVGKAWHS
jgi:tRNA A37 methylthiotransferase MiaB